MSSADNYALQKFGFKAAAVATMTLSMEQIVNIMCYLKRRTYQLGDALTWTELREGCRIDVLAPESMRKMEFTWSDDTIGEVSKDRLMKMNGTITFTKNAEELERLYKMAEMFELEVKKDPHLWETIFRTMLTELSVKGCRILDDDDIRKDSQEEVMNSMNSQLEKYLKGPHTDVRDKDTPEEKGTREEAGDKEGTQ